jgi:hypothetical protein
LSAAIFTGNDRNKNSQISYNYGADGEELAIIKAGAQTGQSTYVTNLNENIGKTYLKNKNNQSQNIILVYSGSALESIGPNYPRSNGFSVFHFTEKEIMERSLLAIIQISN